MYVCMYIYEHSSSMLRFYSSAKITKHHREGLCFIRILYMTSTYPCRSCLFDHAGWKFSSIVKGYNLPIIHHTGWCSLVEFSLFDPGFYHCRIRTESWYRAEKGDGKRGVQCYRGGVSTRRYRYMNILIREFFDWMELMIEWEFMV